MQNQSSGQASKQAERFRSSKPSQQAKGPQLGLLACYPLRIYHSTGYEPPTSNTPLGSSSSPSYSSVPGALRGYFLRKSDSSRTLNVSGSWSSLTRLASSSKYPSYANPSNVRQSLRISECLSCKESNASDLRTDLACSSSNTSSLVLTSSIVPIRYALKTSSNGVASTRY